MNSFLTFARNAGKLLVSWSRVSRTGKPSRTGSLDTTVDIKYLDEYQTSLDFLFWDLNIENEARKGCFSFFTLF